MIEYMGYREYLAKEVSQGKVVVPFDSPPIPYLQVSSSGIIPNRAKWESDVSLQCGPFVSGGV